MASKMIFRYGEYGTGGEPTAHVVARNMIEHGVVRDAEDVVLQLLQVVYAHYLGVRNGVAEYEVAEAHVLLHEPPQVDAHLFRVLIDEAEAFSLCLFTVLRLRTLHYQRQEGVVLANGTQQFQTCFCILFAFHGEAHIADYAVDIVGITAVNVHSLLVGAGQHHLGPSAHTQCCGMTVECFGGETLALCEDIIIEIGQDAAVKAYAVLHKQNHLDASFADIAVEIHLVLYEFYDGKDEVRVAEPAEDIVENAQVLVLHTLRYAVGEGRKHHAVYRGETRFYVVCHAERIVVGIARHTYHEVDVHCPQHLIGFLGGAHLRECGRITQSQLHILVVNLLLHTPVVLKHKGIVRVGDDENIVDAAHHQIDKRDIFQIKLAVFLWYHWLFSFLFL